MTKTRRALGGVWIRRALHEPDSEALPDLKTFAYDHKVGRLSLLVSLRQFGFASLQSFSVATVIGLIALSVLDVLTTTKTSIQFMRCSFCFQWRSELGRRTKSLRYEPVGTGSCTTSF
jgi:hypothetical protein